MQSKGKTLEGVNDPLTLGDQLSHQAIAGSFKAAFPKTPVSKLNQLSIKSLCG